MLLRQVSRGWWNDRRWALGYLQEQHGATQKDCGEHKPTGDGESLAKGEGVVRRHRFLRHGHSIEGQGL